MGNKAAKTDVNHHSNNHSSNQEDEEMQEEVTAHSGRQNTSYYTMIKQSYQQLVNAIIRPPRCDYDTSQLGPKMFAFCGKTFERHDFELTNLRKMKFQCSMWQPIDSDRPNNVLPCVIYMHGNSSSRLEALSSLSLVLSLGATLLAFDFCGSGKSEGEYVSLGTFEKDDLQEAIRHLRDEGNTSTIALWGRSMGAATALLHGERDPSIAGMVLDSAFADLVMLAEDMVEKGREKGLFAPGLLVKIAIKFVRSSVQKAAHFDIKTLSPIEHADKCYIPAMFVAAENDNFVSKMHSEKICEKYGGDKNLVIVEGDHNSARPMFLYDSVSIFLVNTLQIPEHWMLPEGHNFIRKYPWTYKSRQMHAQQQYQQEQIMDREAHAAMLASMGMQEQDMFQQIGTGEDGDGSNDYDEDDLALQEILALSLMESESATLASDSHASIMQKDSEMQHDVQSKLFNLLNGGVGVPSMASRQSSVRDPCSDKHHSDKQVASSDSHSSSERSVAPTGHTAVDHASSLSDKSAGLADQHVLTLSSRPSSRAENEVDELGLDDHYGGAGIAFHKEKAPPAQSASGSGHHMPVHPVHAPPLHVKSTSTDPADSHKRSKDLLSQDSYDADDEPGGSLRGLDSDKSNSNRSNRSVHLGASGDNSHNTSQLHFSNPRQRNHLGLTLHHSNSGNTTSGTYTPSGGSAHHSPVRGAGAVGGTFTFEPTEVAELPKHPKLIANKDYGQDSSYHDMFPGAFSPTTSTKLPNDNHPQELPHKGLDRQITLADFDCAGAEAVEDEDDLCFSRANSAPIEHNPPINAETTSALLREASYGFRGQSEFFASDSRDNDDQA